MNGIVTKIANVNDPGQIAGSDGADRIYYPAAVVDGAALAVGDAVTFDEVGTQPGAPARAVNIRTGGA